MTNTMTKHPENNTPARPSRRAQLHGLLFAGTALGTTLLTVLGVPAGKLPPFKGE